MADEREGVVHRRVNPRREAFFRRFAAEYTIDFNGKAALLRAGWKGKYPKQYAHHLMKHWRVQELVDEEIRLRLERTRLNADRVLLELAAVSFSRIHDVMDWREGFARLREPQEIDPQAMAAIQQIRTKEKEFTAQDGTVVRTREVTVRMYPKIPALQKLAPHVGLDMRDPAAALAASGQASPFQLVIIQRNEGQAPAQPQALPAGRPVDAAVGRVEAVAVRP